MSSVRPLTRGEQSIAYGGPITQFGAFFGATAGMLSYLNQMKIQSNAKWFPTRASNLGGMVLIGGGGVVGYYVALKLFGNPALQRLDAQHNLDRAANKWRLQN